MVRNGKYYEYANIVDVGENIGYLIIRIVWVCECVLYFLKINWFSRLNFSDEHNILLFKTGL